MYYKVESYVASEQAAKILYENDLTPVFVSDNPVLNAQHVVFEAAKAYQNGLLYHAALAGVTSAPAELLGLGERIGKIKEGFDADVVVWDSDPLSVGATPVQVWIDGTGQFKDPYVLDKPLGKPIKHDQALATVNDMAPVEKKDVVFTGVSKIIGADTEQSFTNFENLGTVIISNGKITCTGDCTSKLASVTNVETINLRNGYITPPLTAFNSYIGLEELSSDPNTQDGKHTATSLFSRAIDGLALDTKQLAASYKHGVTRAISAPKFGSEGHKGVSVGFHTGSQTPLEERAVLKEEVGVHYTFTTEAKDDSTTPSISSSIASLRDKLLKAAADLQSNTTSTNPSDHFSESSYLRLVLLGDLPLILTVHSADTISSLLRLKSSLATLHPTTSIHLILYGAAEAHLLPPSTLTSLPAHNISIVLSPLHAYAETWSQRRSLPGAPLSSKTTLDVLLDAGVHVGIGVSESWDVRNLRLMAGWAYKNGEGRLKSEAEAWGLVSGNLERMLGLDEKAEEGMDGEFVVWEGSPLEIGARLRAIGTGREDGFFDVFE